MVNKGMTMQGLGAIVVGILALVVIYTIIPVVGSQLDTAVTIPTSVYSTGTFTFSGNVSNGELVNITSGANVYRFEFNTTNNGSAITCVTTNCIPVNLTYQGVCASCDNWNSSNRTFMNLTGAINGNASTAAMVTATNTSGVSTNTTTITSDAYGTGGNYALADTGANIASSGMTGGATGSQWDSVTNPSIPTAVDFWEALGAILKVAGVIVVVGGVLQTLRGLRG